MSESEIVRALPALGTKIMATTILPSEQAASARDLAKRAKRLAFTFVDGPDRDLLLRYAEELDAQAADLEAKTVRETTSLPAPHVTHLQQQTQQQRADSPPPDTSDPKSEPQS
jgi:hypothetical protein